jgi:hypothetical protein
MRKARATAFTILALAAPAAILSMSGSHSSEDSVDISIARDGAPRDCDDFRVEAGGRAVATASQHLTVPAAAAELSLAAAPRGGISVSGWGGKDYDLLACKAAVGPDRAAAAAGLAGISVAVQGGAVETSGPAGKDWMVYWIVRAPRGAAMNLSTHNGPLSVRQAEGTFTIRGTNGPVSLDGVEGSVSVEVNNGPVAISNGGGDVQVRTHNGPIAVTLEGDEWQGEGLDARAVNGPLSVDIAEGYRGGVRVESSGHAPWSCSGPCERGERAGDDGSRSLEIGPQPARVRLSTVNGPVAIATR